MKNSVQQEILLMINSSLSKRTFCEKDVPTQKIISAIERGKKSYAFPWQLATIVRAGMIMPNFMYDWIAVRNSFRE